MVGFYNRLILFLTFRFYIFHLEREIDIAFTDSTAKHWKSQTEASSQELHQLSNINGRDANS